MLQPRLREPSGSHSEGAFIDIVEVKQPQLLQSGQLLYPCVGPACSWETQQPQLLETGQFLQPRASVEVVHPSRPGSAAEEAQRPQLFECPHLLQLRPRHVDVPDEKPELLRRGRKLDQGPAVDGKGRQLARLPFPLLPGTE